MNEKEPDTGKVRTILPGGMDTARAESPIESVLVEHGVLCHAVINKKLHGWGIFQPAEILGRPALLAELATHAVHSMVIPPAVDVVVGHGPGGAAVASLVAGAYFATAPRISRAPWPNVCHTVDGAGQTVELPKLFHPLVRGTRTLCVEHAFTSTSRVSERLAVLRALGAEPQGVLILCSLDPIAEKQIVGGRVWVGAQIVNQEYEAAYDAEPAESGCPQCKNRVPIRADLFSGSDWLLFNPDYPKRDVT